MLSMVILGRMDIRPKMKKVRMRQISPLWQLLNLATRLLPQLPNLRLEDSREGMDLYLLKARNER